MADEAGRDASADAREMGGARSLWGALLRRRLGKGDGAADGRRPSVGTSGEVSDHPESGVITEDRNPTPDVMSGAPSPSVVDDAFAEPAVDGQPDEGDARRPDLVVWLHGLLRRQYTLPVLMVTVIGIVAMMNHFSGVDWGDDFALYMSQAKALNTGNIAEVVENTRYAVDNSGWNTFSPYLYPWGWPLLVAPVYAVFGLDYEAIKVLEVIALCVFLLVFYVLVRRRTGPVPATALTLLIGLSPSFVGATDTVLSDLPFLCFVGLTLWWMDQCRIRGILTCGRRDLLILGLLLAYAYNTRREGITLLIPLVALHLTVLAGRAGRPRSLGFLREVEWRPVLLPYATFAVTTIALHLALPSVLRPNAPGAGLQNASARLTYYKDVLAEHVGLKDFGQPMQLLGSQDAAALAVKALVALAIIGVVARLVHRFEEDLILASYLAGASLLMLVSPYQESRYLFTITPLLAYFAYQALPTLARLARLGEGMVSAASLVPLVALAGLLTYQFEDIKRSTDYHRVYHYTVNGPESPEAVEMLSTVRQMTRGDDVLLFFRARAMSLYTDRKAVQGSNLQQLLPRVDWYVMAKGSTYSQALLTDGDAAALGLTKTWENGGWVLWRVPSPAS